MPDEISMYQAHLKCPNCQNDFGVMLPMGQKVKESEVICATCGLNYNLLLAEEVKK